jgi:hypothetical protein
MDCPNLQHLSFRHGKPWKAMVDWKWRKDLVLDFRVGEFFS